MKSKKFIIFGAAAILALTPAIAGCANTVSAFGLRGVRKNALEAKSKTIYFNSTTGSGISGYDKTWKNSCDGINLTMVNWNNNNWNNNRNYVKAGRKNNASVATITTEQLSFKVESISITIDAITQDKINSIKLYTSSDNNTWNEEGSYDRKTGEQSLELNTPTANLFYKLEFDCASGSSNGLVTLSSVVFNYHEDVNPDVNKYTIHFNSKGGSSVDDIQNVIEGETISSLPAPTKNNDEQNQIRYEFEGWYIGDSEGNVTFEEENRFTTTTAVTSDLYL